MSAEFEASMRIAIEEAMYSLREGNHGFGAVILKDSKVLARAHDTEGADRNPMAHAEIRAIGNASSVAGDDLSGCLLLCTQEPCYICAEAIIGAQIPRVIYGYRVADTASLERKPNRLSAEEIFRSAGANIRIESGLLQQECAVLYNQAVRAELKKLRGATDEQLRQYDHQLTARRLAWYRKEKPNLSLGAGDLAEQGYRLLLNRLRVNEAEAPVVHRQEGAIVFHSKNFCPTLQACRILGLDTRTVCRFYNEGATDQLIRQLDPRLRFQRNYQEIRPYTEYCEERITYAQE